MSRRPPSRWSQSQSTRNDSYQRRHSLVHNTERQHSWDRLPDNRPPLLGSEPTSSYRFDISPNQDRRILASHQFSTGSAGLEDVRLAPISRGASAVNWRSSHSGRDSDISRRSSNNGRDSDGSWRSSHGGREPVDRWHSSYDVTADDRRLGMLSPALARSGSRTDRPSFPGPSREIHTSSRRNWNSAPNRDIRQHEHQESQQGDTLRSPSFPRVSRRPSPIPSFSIPFPPTDYLKCSQETNITSNDVVTKLLVLDLNGALIYRPSTTGDRRRAYPRPFLGCFLEYLFLAEPMNGDGSRAQRPWEVFVWSSAQPQNVRNMVETTFGPRWTEGIWVDEENDSRVKRLSRGEGRLLEVWARDKMGLSESDYHRKVQTTKDLRKVCHHLGNQYDERTTVLLDDSPLKAIFQPWSQVVIPEFDKKEFQAARAAVQPAHPAPVESAERDPCELGQTSMDSILLAVIGILEEMRTIKNVPAWVRAGGIQRRSENDSGKDETGCDTQGEHSEISLKDLPSYESYVHWYQRPDTLRFWICRGKKALQRKGITLKHGLTTTGAGEVVPLSDPSLAHATGQSESVLSPVKQSVKPGRKSSPPVEDTLSETIEEIHGSQCAYPAVTAVVYRQLQTVADSRFVTQKQRDNLYNALSTLEELGLGPKGSVPTSMPPSTAQILKSPLPETVDSAFSRTLSPVHSVNKKDIKWLRGLTEVSLLAAKTLASDLRSKVKQSTSRNPRQARPAKFDTWADQLLKLETRLALVQAPVGPQLNAVIRKYEEASNLTRIQAAANIQQSKKRKRDDLTIGGIGDFVEK